MASRHPSRHRQHVDSTINGVTDIMFKYALGLLVHPYCDQNETGYDGLWDDLKSARDSVHLSSKLALEL